MKVRFVGHNDVIDEFARYLTECYCSEMQLETIVSKGGRPSLYDPKYCDECIAFMAKGFSKSAFAGHIGVNRDTLQEWEAKHPEFSVATKDGAVARLAFLEARLLSDTFASPQITAMIFALKNAAPWEWRDRYEHTGADGGPISITVVRFTDEAPLTIEGEVIEPAKQIASDQ